MTTMDLVAIRARIAELVANRRSDGDHDAAGSELAQIAERLLAHLEAAQEREERAKTLAAALEYRATAGTLDELLMSALASYKEGR